MHSGSHLPLNASACKKQEEQWSSTSRHLPMWRGPAPGLQLNMHCIMLRVVRLLASCKRRLKCVQPAGTAAAAAAAAALVTRQSAAAHLNAFATGLPTCLAIPGRAAELPVGAGLRSRGSGLPAPLSQIWAHPWQPCNRSVDPQGRLLPPAALAAVVDCRRRPGASVRAAHWLQPMLSAPHHAYLHGWVILGGNYRPSWPLL